MCMPVGQQSGFHFLLDVRWLTRPIRPHADPIRRPCSALRQLVIQEAKLDRASVEALRPLGALTALCLPRCELLSLPGGPYLAGLRRYGGRSPACSMHCIPVPFPHSRLPGACGVTRGGCTPCSPAMQPLLP